MIPINSIYTIVLYIILLAAVLLLLKHFLFSVTQIPTNLESNNRNIVEFFQDKRHDHPSGAGHTHLNKLQAAIKERINARLKTVSSDKEGKQKVVKEAIIHVAKELAKLHNLNETDQAEVVKQITESSSQDDINKLAENQDDPKSTKPTKQGSGENTDNETDLLQSLSRSIQSIVSTLAKEKQAKEVLKPTEPRQQETSPPTITVNVPERTVQDDTECCGIKIFDKSLELKDINKCITQHLDEKYKEWKKSDDVDCKTPHNILSKTSNCGGPDPEKGIIAKYYENWNFLYKQSDFYECKYKYDRDDKIPDKHCSAEDKLKIGIANLPCEERDPPQNSLGKTQIRCGINGPKFNVFKCSESTKVKCR